MIELEDDAAGPLPSRVTEGTGPPASRPGAGETSGSPVPRRLSLTHLLAVAGAVLWGTSLAPGPAGPVPLAGSPGARLLAGLEAAAGTPWIWIALLIGVWLGGTLLVADRAARRQLRDPARLAARTPGLI